MQEKDNVTVINILRHSVKFNVVNIVSRGLAFLATIVIATVLRPEEYGIIGFLWLWLFYADLINPGMDSAASREMPYLLGRGENEKAEYLQNVAITGKLLYSLLPFTVMTLASFFYSNELIRIGLILTAIRYIVIVNVNNWSGFNQARRKFNCVALGNFVRGITTQPLTILLVFLLRVYGVLIAPIVGALLEFLYYIKKDGINYRFRLDLNETRKLVKIGLPLVLLTFIYWGYRMADRTMVAIFLSLRDLGLYTFTATIVAATISLFADFGGVLQPILWTNLGKAKNYIDEFKSLRRIAVFISIAAAVSITISQIGFYLLTHLLAKNYIEGIYVFNILALSIFLVSITIIPSVILNSSVINKQTLNAKIRSIGLILNIILNYLIITMGFGIVGVAAATIVTYILVALLLFFVIRGYMFYSGEEFLKFMVTIFTPFIVSFILCLAVIQLEGIVQNTYTCVLYLLILTGATWLTVLKLLYKEYLPTRKLVDIVLNRVKTIF